MYVLILDSEPLWPKTCPPTDQGQIAPDNPPDKYPRTATILGHLPPGQVPPPHEMMVFWASFVHIV